MAYSQRYFLSLLRVVKARCAPSLPSLIVFSLSFFGCERAHLKGYQMGMSVFLSCTALFFCIKLCESFDEL